jgi:hypothetical protein
LVTGLAIVTPRGLVGVISVIPKSFIVSLNF